MGEINESAVWERVTAASRSGGATREPDGPIGPELLAAIERTQTAAQSLRQLMGRSGGETQQALRTVLRQKQSQRRTLSALYFFLTGQRPALTQPAVSSRRETMAEALRRLLREEEISAGRLEALAVRSTGETGEVLRTLCVQDRKLFHQLLSLLGQNVE